MEYDPKYVDNLLFFSTLFVSAVVFDGIIIFLVVINLKPFFSSAICCEILLWLNKGCFCYYYCFQQIKDHPADLELQVTSLLITVFIYLFFQIISLLSLLVLKSYTFLLECYFSHYLEQLKTYWTENQAIVMRIT